MLYDYYAEQETSQVAIRIYVWIRFPFTTCFRLLWHYGTDVLLLIVLLVFVEGGINCDKKKEKAVLWVRDNSNT